MKTVWLTHDYQEAAMKLKGKPPALSNVRQTLDEDTKLIAPDGRITALFLRNVIPARLHERAYELLKQVNSLPGNRPAAVGTTPLPRHRRKKDGGWSARWGVNENVLRVLKKQGVRYGILGYLPCHKTRLTEKYPKMLLGNEALIRLVDNLYAREMPTRHAEQRAVVAPRWRLWNTAFSTIYVAKKWRTAFHRDGNLKGAMTAITPSGDFTDGALVLGRWSVAIPYKPGDLVIFDAEQLHGNLPIKGKRKRLSVALYSARGMAACK